MQLTHNFSSANVSHTWIPQIPVLQVRKLWLLFSQIFASSSLFSIAMQWSWLNSAVSVMRHLRWEVQKGEQRMKNTHSVHVWPSMTLSLSGPPCSSNKAATASSVSKRSHGQKRQGNTGPAANRKTISQTQFKRAVKSNSVDHNAQRAADQKARRKNASVSGVERLQARRRRSILCSGRRGNMKAETIKRLTIKGWVALKLITAAVVCYQLECDALITSWGRSKKNKKQNHNKNLSTLQRGSTHSDLH